MPDEPPDRRVRVLVDADRRVRVRLRCGGCAMSRLSARIVRNSRQSFLLGASWSHHKSWPQRLTHIYLGPLVLTITKRGPRG